MAELIQDFLTDEELDTIGEIMNISMGSAATAVSTMLEKQVIITTPQLEQVELGKIGNIDLEPALIVTIKYVEGIEGNNVTMLRKHDVQIILDLLMGNDLTIEGDDAEFDEMSMSAACEVMNQMMGASATALSEILEIPINISPPTAVLVQTKEDSEAEFRKLHGDSKVVAISFKMSIKDVMDTTFTSFLTTELASRIVRNVNGEDETEAAQEEQPMVVDEAPPPVVQQPPPVVQQPPPVVQQPPPVAYPQQPVAEYNPVQIPQQSVDHTAQQSAQNRQPMQFSAPSVPQSVQMHGAPLPQYTAPDPLQYMQQGQQFPGGNVQQQYAPSDGHYGYPLQPPHGGYAHPNAMMKNAEFPDFAKQRLRATYPAQSNMGLLMGVQLEVSIIIGRTKRKIKEIMDFGQGTVVELDKQTGSPAEIMVNGQLLAYGDVIVVGDNFGIRITEIVGTKELLDSLESNL